MSNKLDCLVKMLENQAALIDRLNVNCGFKYKTTASLILANGIGFEKQIKSPFQGQPKSCFDNCYQALWKYSQLNYCEGFAINSNVLIPVSHAWLVNNHGEVIDPTWTEDNYQQNIYFGVVLNKIFVREMVKKNKIYGIVDSDYMNRHQLLKEGFPSYALNSKFYQQ
jgi:hypothetical protein